MRIFYVWHKDLVHRNKTHYKRPYYLGNSEHDVILIVRKRAYISLEIQSCVTNIVRVPWEWFGILDYVLLLVFGITYYILNESKNAEIVYSTPNALSLLSGVILKIIYARKVLWICDLWDDPRYQSRFYHRRSTRYLYFVYNKIVLKVPRLADLVIAVGGSLNEGLPSVLQREFGVLKQRILPVTNGVDLDMFYPQPSSVEKPYPSSLVRVLYVGHIGPDLGISTLLEAISILVEERDIEISLILVGFCTSKEKIWLYDKTKRLGLHDNIQFKGESESTEIPNIIAEADICVYPFPHQRDLPNVLPIKVYEYLAMAKPVVSSNLPGVRQIIKHRKNGLLVEPENPRAMADAIWEIARSETLAHSLIREARPSIFPFAWINIHRKILARIHTLICQNEA